MSAPIQLESRLTGQNTKEELVLRREVVPDALVFIQLGNEIVGVRYPALALAVAALALTEPDATTPDSVITTP